ncbi:alpha/beta hydrolase fold protein [Bisporella sp. PMI_857]|nr:alpha/beta hydrolase fold protein [Bisporella sp. PMI_857]
MSILSYLRAYFFRLFANFTTTNKLVSPPAALTEEPTRSYFRLDNDSSDTLALPDGRKLGYAQYGSQTGRPILLLHGIPGSRIDGAFFDELAQKVNARIITADRPGLGWSSPHPGRTLLDHPKDLEHLAKHLGLEEYSVLGVSGGGPYALACAVSLPREKLKCVSIVCGLGPPEVGMSGTNFWNWIGFSGGFRYSPVFIARWYWQQQPEGRLDLTDEERLELLLQRVSKSLATAHEKDLKILKDEGFHRFVLRTTRECLVQGLEGWLQDGKLMCMDHGFRIEDIRPDLPVHLWYGKFDTNVPLSHGEHIAARLGGRAHFRVENETHASLEINWQEEILKELVRNT